MVEAVASRAEALTSMPEAPAARKDGRRSGSQQEPIGFRRGSTSSRTKMQAAQ